MARFTFKLEGVLKQRRWEEQQRQREMAEKQRVLTELEIALIRLNDEVRAANDELRAHCLTGALDMGFLSAHRRFLGAMQRRAVELAQRMTVAQKHVHQAQILLADASRRRKAIEKLRERQLAQWRFEQNRKQLAEQDEIGMQIACHDLTEAAEATT